LNHPSHDLIFTTTTTTTTTENFTDAFSVDMEDWESYDCCERQEIIWVQTIVFSGQLQETSEEDREK
jgi:hypothetical protein